MIPSDAHSNRALTDDLRCLVRQDGPDRTPKYSRIQILEILEAARDGGLIKDVCRQYGITDSTFYRWRKRYGQAVATPATPEQQLRHAEAENRRLRKRLSDLDRMSA